MDAEFTGEKYDSRFKGKFKVPGSKETLTKKKLRWSQFSVCLQQKCCCTQTRQVFPISKTLNSDLSPSPNQWRMRCSLCRSHLFSLEAINIIEQDLYRNKGGTCYWRRQRFQDIQGDVYEMLLSEIASAGKNGQFRTPCRHWLTDSWIGRAAARPASRIPACGTEAFCWAPINTCYWLGEKEESGKLARDEDGFERSTLTRLLQKK